MHIVDASPEPVADVAPMDVDADEVEVPPDSPMADYVELEPMAAAPDDRQVETESEPMAAESEPPTAVEAPHDESADAIPIAIPETLEVAIPMAIAIPKAPAMQFPPEHFQRLAVCEPAGPQDSLFCNWCNFPVEKSKARLTSKGSAKLKCDRCNSTFAKMNGALGQWPTSAFNMLSREEQSTFYAKAAKESKSKNIVNLLEISLNKYKRKEFSWALGGQFLPLSAWKVQGFDVERIAATTKPEDIQENVQLGTCYRVRIFSTLESGAEGYEGSQRLSSTSGDVDKNLGANMWARNTRPRLDQASSSSGHASLEAETKAQFKERMKQEKAERKVIEKRHGQVKLLASQLSKKLAPPLQYLSSLLNSVESNVHETMVKLATTKRDEAAALQVSLNEIVANPETASFDPVDKKEIVKHMTKELDLLALSVKRMSELQCSAMKGK